MREGSEHRYLSSEADLPQPKLACRRDPDVIEAEHTPKPLKVLVVVKDSEAPFGRCCRDKRIAVSHAVVGVTARSRRQVSERPPPLLGRRLP